MAISVRKFTSPEEVSDFAHIASNAYPGFGSSVAQNAEAVTQLMQEETNSFWGCFEGDRMLGGMRILDLSMNYCGGFVKAGGLGFVAVGLEDKRRGVARRLVKFFLDYCRDQDMGMTLLYPFRPDFYQRLGFGFGQEGREYALAPQQLPTGSSPLEVRPLRPGDMEAVGQCYHRFSATQHGYCRKTWRELEALFKAKGLYGFWAEGRLQGYLAFDFGRAHETNAMKNDLLVREWVWETPHAFSQLCSFLRSQRDQVHRIIFSTQQPDFHFLSPDPRNGTDNMFNKHYHECHTGGVGLMYRITSLPLWVEAISHRNFNQLDCGLRVEVADAFCSEQAGSYSLVFEEGKVRLGDQGAGDITMSLEGAELSSLFMGSVEFSTLYRLGKVRTDPQVGPRLSRLFWCDERPQCVTSF